MLQIRKKDASFVAKMFVHFFFISTFRALGVEGPRGGAVVEPHGLEARLISPFQVSARNLPHAVA